MSQLKAQIKQKKESNFNKNKSRNSEELRPFSMHIVNIGQSKPILIKRTRKKMMNKTMNDFKSNNNKLVQHSNNKKFQFSNRSGYISNSIYNKKKDRYDQSCFSDYRLKYGISAQIQQTIDDNYKQIKKQDIRSPRQQNRQHNKQIVSLNKQKQQGIKQKNDDGKQQLHNKPFKQEKSVKKNRRKVFSQTQRRAYFPQIGSFQQKSKRKSQKVNNLIDLDDPKLDGWIAADRTYELDRKHDIIQYTTTRDQSRHFSKNFQSKIHHNKNLNSSFFVFE